MATNKATTTDDLKADNGVDLSDGQAANAAQLEQVSELTDPAMIAEVDEPKMSKVKSPLGTVTEVPESILQALLDSGYSKTK